jgi:hypothetical protein
MVLFSQTPLVAGAHVAREVWTDKRGDYWHRDRDLMKMEAGPWKKGRGNG